MTEQEKALHELQKLAFALQEAVLYLDGHPHNTAALRFYEKTMVEYGRQMAVYERRWGQLAPLAPCAMSEVGGRGWQWTTQPWPWEMNYPAGSDGDMTETTLEESADTGEGK